MRTRTRIKKTLRFHLLRKKINMSKDRDNKNTCYESDVVQKIVTSNTLNKNS